MFYLKIINISSLISIELYSRNNIFIIKKVYYKFINSLPYLFTIYRIPK